MTNAKGVKKLIDTLLKDYELVIVSNREPYIHMHTPEGKKCKKPAGGLTAALDPLMQATGGTWVAGGSGDADRGTVDRKDRVKVPPEKPSYTLKRVWMSKREVDLFYFGFSNQVLWPLCHQVFQKPIFDQRFWEGYKYSNKLYAKAVFEEIKHKKAFIWFQDYHLALCPRMIKKKAEKLKPGRRKIVKAHFWHIPWPPYTRFATCPWARELIEGMLANDLICFHLDKHAINFLASVEKLLGKDVDYKKKEISDGVRVVKVRNYPISVDYRRIEREGKKVKVRKEAEKLRVEVPYKYLGVGVDRIDYTKGIPERLRAVDRFLEKYPKYQHRFVYVEAGAPSRMRIPAYSDLNNEIEGLVDEINWKYQSGYWRPIKYITEKLNYSRLLGLFRTADVCLVTSLEDGMNLVGKEFTAANVDNRGMLVLSKFAGAYEELKDALLVNPYDVEEVADAIKECLEMGKKERETRVAKMRKTVRKNDIFEWLKRITTEVGKLV